MQAGDLHDSDKNTEAVAKYREALKLDPENARAQYELSATLSGMGKADEAIAILEKLVASPGSSAEAYDLLAGLYNEAKNNDRATVYYARGSAAFPGDQKLNFDAANFYLQQKKYAEAEASAIAAIKLDPQDSDSQRIYALAVTAQNKNANALLAWCSYLILNPDGDDSAEAFKSVEKLLPANQSATGDANEQLAANLEAAFNRIGLAAPQGNDAFFRNFYANYFAKLAPTNNMPTLARGISVTAHPENKEWLRTHSKEVNDLAMWINSVPRSF